VDVAPGDQTTRIDRSAVGRMWALDGSVRLRRTSWPRASRPGPAWLRFSLPVRRGRPRRRRGWRRGRCRRRRGCGRRRRSGPGSRPPTGGAGL